ncbi:MAG: phenylalanine--tRNA ligase subunit alpha [Thermotogae bacterium]|nr:phenylalanine--tRNA ligase subunit alpha [Thermotogota bacterium]
MMEDVRREFYERLRSVKSVAELDALKAEYIGKKGKITSQLKRLKDLPPEERRRVGSILNALRREFERAIKDRREDLLDTLKPADPTLPGRPWSGGVGTLHPIKLVANEILKVLENMGFEIGQGPEVETDENNFTLLNIPPWHPARDMQQSLYLDNGMLLRTHTSPFQIRYMREHSPPLKAATFGKVFRADEFDATHSPVFHQIEGFAVDRNISIPTLRWTLQQIVKALFGEKAKVKFVPSYFPFTEPSMEVAVWYRGEWLEMLGCGMIHPQVLKNVGIDPDEWSGYAFGIGVERFAMVKYGIEDIRLFYENDRRFLQQFRYEDWI